jgi:hypothetical protein
MPNNNKLMLGIPTLALSYIYSTYYSIYYPLHWECVNFEVISISKINVRFHLILLVVMQKSGPPLSHLRLSCIIVAFDRPRARTLRAPPRIYAGRVNPAISKLFLIYSYKRRGPRRRTLRGTTGAGETLVIGRHGTF